MQKIDRTRQKRRYLALSFFVPFGVMLLCFILGGLWPFGDRQVLAHDMWHQYYPFFVSFREKLRQLKQKEQICPRRMATSEQRIIHSVSVFQKSKQAQIMFISKMTEILLWMKSTERKKTVLYRSELTVI